MKNRLIVLLVLAALALLAACGEKATAAKIITVTDSGWDSQKVHNEIARIVVEHAFDGYAFETSTASSTMNWQSLVAGAIDLDIESWTNNIATYPADIARGDVVDLGILVPDSAQGFYVPRYVVEGDAARGIAPAAPDLKTVADLKKYANVFPDDEQPSRGRIYGSIPGWMADEVLFNKYEFYGLDESFNYMRLGSEVTLFASLVAADNLGIPWVGYCYEPTWVAGKLDLILLEDAPYDDSLFMLGQCAFPSQPLKIVASKGFAEKAPELAAFFANYTTGSEKISQALAYIDEQNATHVDAAVWFLKNNDGLIDEWLPAENAAALRDYLAGLQ